MGQHERTAVDKGATQNSQTLMLDVDQRKWEGEENEEGGQQKISGGNLSSWSFLHAFNLNLHIWSVCLFVSKETS